jgi:2-polyprenyl-6-methoxyphenol hydroxylase-like FAD-dependent oxidoreductase
MRQPDVLVAGAGIGGLTAALSLHAVGVDTEVVESAREIRPLGVGINLLPHAVRELIELGLGDDLAAIGIATAENVYCDRFGGRLFTEPRGLAQGYRWPQYSVHRGELQRLLLSAVHARLGAGNVRTGLRLTGFAEASDCVRARVRARDTGDETEIAARMLVGADGVHSAARAQLHPVEGPLLWSGVRMWRGVTTAKPFLTGRSMIIARDGRDAELIAYPIRSADDVVINWVCLVSVAEPGPLSEEVDWNRAGRLADVLPYYRDWSLGWLDVPGLLAGSAEILEYPMVDREPLPFWGRGRVTLLGDAAHPMYPVGANGASQAIVDARALAYELAASGPAGLARYEQRRRDATAAVVLANRRMQRAGGTELPTELARITDTYRNTTGSDVHDLNNRASFTPAHPH